MLGELKKRLSANEIDAEFTDGAVDAISDAGYDKDYGARPLRRAVQSKIEDMLSEKIIDGDVKPGSKITVDYENGEFVTK